MSETSKESFVKNKIKENANKNNNNNKIIENHDTFNKLLELQLLIKKESGLKELCN